MNEEDSLCLYADFAKIDEEQRTVFGYASTETRDQQGEIIRKEAIVSALPQYLRYPAVREMHQPSAVGTGVEAHVDDKGLWFGAKVVDDAAWRKVKAGVYRGFSMGGKITKRDPSDRSIATAIRLDEISLVDRPANPDAQFTLIKRASDGLLHVQPTQCWTCGVIGHQHTSKIECQACIEQQSLRQHARLTGGSSYASIDDIRDDARYRSQEYAKMADSNRNDAATHSQSAAQAKLSSDSVTAAYHDVMAKSCSALATHHDSVARHYLTLSNPSEDKMDGSVQAALAEAEGAVDALTKGVSSAAITGVKPTPLALAQEAHTHGLNNDASTISRMADAVRSHADAAASIADGAPDKAKHQIPEADSHRSVAEFHAQAASSYHDMVARNIKPQGEVAHGENEDTVINPKNADQTGGRQQANGGKVLGTKTTGKSTTNASPTRESGKDVAAKAFLAKASREHNEKVSLEMEKLSKQFGGMMEKAKASGDKEREEKLADCMKALQGWSKNRKEFGKSMGVIEQQLKDMAESKAADPSAGDQEKSPNPIGSGDEEGAGGGIKKAFKPNHKLIAIGPSLFDKKGNWFGKRDFPEAKRKEMADTGAAMPDGSFPIANQDDVNNAARLVGHGKNPEKAKAHIKSRAKAIGAKLPDSWKDDDDAKKAGDDCDHAFGKGDDANKCSKCGFMRKADSKNKEDDKDPEPDDDDADDGDNKDKQEFRDFDEDDPAESKTHKRLLKTEIKKLRAQVKNIKGLHKSREAGAALSKSVTEIDNIIAKAERRLAHSAYYLSQQRMFKAVTSSVARGGPGPGWLRTVSKALATRAKDDEKGSHVDLANRLTKLEKKIKKKLREEKLLKQIQERNNDPLQHGTSTKDPNAEGSEATPGAGKPTADSPSLSKTEKERDRALGLLKQLTPMVKMVQDAKAEIAGMRAENASLKEELRKVSAQPMPRVSTGRPVTKTDDSKNVFLSPDETKDGGLLKLALENVDKIPAGRARAEALIALARDSR